MQENKVTNRIPIFGVVFMAGLGLACPPDLRERSVIIKMVKATGKQQVADFSLAETRAAFTYAGTMLKSWADRLPQLDVSSVRGLHPALVHREMDVWGPLFTMALAADGGEVGEWTRRLLLAFERVQLDASEPVYAPEDQLLMDYLRFCELHDVSDGIPSGQFAEWATSQDHGAYLSMKPGQFKQFAVSVLGPTNPFYDNEEKKMMRGWAEAVHKMNYDRAVARKADLEAVNGPDEAGTTEWEDF